MLVDFSFCAFDHRVATTVDEKDFVLSNRASQIMKTGLQGVIVFQIPFWIGTMKRNTFSYTIVDDILLTV